MQEAMPPVVMYKRHLIHFKGGRKVVLCERPNRACALTAMLNYTTLLISGSANENDFMGDVDSDSLKNGFQAALQQPAHCVASRPARARRARGTRRNAPQLPSGTGSQDCLDDISVDGDTKSKLEQVIDSLDSSVVLNPINTSCLSFDESVELLLFEKLEIPVMHGCVLDETIETQHSDKALITEQGLSQMRAVLGSKQLVDETNKLGDLAVLYRDSQYFVLYEHKDDLFTLETDENILSEFPGAIWKRLCMNEEESFYLTGEFKPTINQEEAKKKLADEWFANKQATSKKKKKKKASNLATSKEGCSTSESDIPSSIFKGTPPDMEEVSPGMVKYNLVPIQFKGREKSYLSHKPNEANALVALSSYLILVDPNGIYLAVSRQAISIEEMKQRLMSFSCSVLLNRWGEASLEDNDLHTQGITKELLENIMSKLHSCTTLQPLSTSCVDFVACPEVRLFKLLNITLVHGWVLDNPIEDESSHDITAQGISQMHKCINDGSVAVLYNRNQFKILHKHDGDIFILETEESSKQCDAVWKKLCVNEKESFHMTENFTPADDEDSVKLKLAITWFTRRLGEDKKPTSSNNAKKERGKVAKLPGGKVAKLPGDKHATSEVAPHEDVNVEEEPTSKEDDILNVLHTEGHKNFLQFTAENDMSTGVILYDGEEGCMTTVMGREMGLGFLNYIFDKFEEGKCWSAGWELSDMEMEVEAGRKFVITKEADTDLTVEEGTRNLFIYLRLLVPYYMKGKSMPAFFDSLGKDILYFPDPNKSPIKWKRFVKLMRSTLALKAPLVRSTLICEIYIIMALHRQICSPKNPMLLKVCQNWRDAVKNDLPYEQVYLYKNNVCSQYSWDRWSNSLWHVIWFSRNFIQHVMTYLKTMHILHDVTIVELMLARCLDQYIADAIRTIILEFGVDDMFSTVWDHFELSDCSKIPIQQVTQNIDATIESITKADVTLLVPVASSQVKMVDDRIRMIYTEVDGCSSGSCDLFDFKKYLEEKGVVVKSSYDVSSSELYYIEIRNTFKTLEHKVAVAGPFCQDFYDIVGHVMSWSS